MDFQVSVVIPVYNASGFLKQAVESALAQPETAEVVLIEDGSTDHSWQICLEMDSENGKVRSYQHPGGINRGAGPSRNLGMQKSTMDFIAFLDADDFYLPGRFTNTRLVFTENKDCDAVYEAVGIHFQDDLGKQRWLDSDMAAVEITSLKKDVDPQDVFHALVKGGSGHIHLDGLVFKRSILKKTGFMNEEIADTLHEDTDFILKVAAVGCMLPGNLDLPVSRRRVHADNRVSALRSQKKIYRDHMRQRVATYRWCKEKGLNKHKHLTFKRMLVECILHKPLPRLFENNTSLELQKTIRLLTWPLETPCAILERYYWNELIGSFVGFVRRTEIRTSGLKED